MEYGTKILAAIAVALLGICLTLNWSSNLEEEEKFDERKCPNGGFAQNGVWKVDDRNGPRCILFCHKGYNPSGCNVLRPVGKVSWNFDVPVCDKEPLVSGKTLFAIGTGILSVVAAPVVLPVLGFSAAGITAGSIASAVQGSSIATGSWFALAQSAGAAGLAATTKVGIGGAVSAAAYAATAVQNGGCEPI